MKTVVSIVPLLAILVSVAAAFGIFFLRNTPNGREACSITAALVKFGLVMSLYPLIRDGYVVECPLVAFPAGLMPNLGFALRVDALGFLFAAVASFLWILTTMYSIGYMRALNEHSQARYYVCFALALTGALGVAFSANLLTLFLFYELITVSTYLLVVHDETEESYSAGTKYLTYLMGTGKLFFLPAIIFTFGLTGTLDFKSAGIFSGVDPFWVGLTLVLFVAGVAKSGLMPFHNWLPSAMVAPTPVSALLHAVAVVKAGVFTVVRIVVHVYGVDFLSHLGIGVVMAFVASVTVVGASVVALRQDNLKLRLAYSTISQLAYVVLGVMLLTPDGVRGSILQIVAHAFGKITLFFCAGAIYVGIHKKYISEMAGIGKTMPWTMGAFTVGAFSMIGVPPLAGFAVKWRLLLGSMEAQQIPIALVLLGSTLLNAAYFLPVIKKAYFEESDDAAHQHEAPLIMRVALVTTAIGTCLVGIYSDFIVGLLKGIA
ncbi:MAG: monovalent cation/H+ antiporter subunit D family protein [Nitrospinae bacterium]|nr:monovalent cation/H+ antiporter subunit D family protein [Nitrospinota bacterium]